MRGSADDHRRSGPAPAELRVFVNSLLSPAIDSFLIVRMRTIFTFFFMYVKKRSLFNRVRLNLET